MTDIANAQRRASAAGVRSRSPSVSALPLTPTSASAPRRRDTETTKPGAAGSLATAAARAAAKLRNGASASATPPPQTTTTKDDVAAYDTPGITDGAGGCGAARRRRGAGALEYSPVDRIYREYNAYRAEKDAAASSSSSSSSKATVAMAAAMKKKSSPGYRISASVSPTTALVNLATASAMKKKKAQDQVGVVAPLVDFFSNRGHGARGVNVASTSASNGVGGVGVGVGGGNETPTGEEARAAIRALTSRGPHPPLRRRPTDDDDDDDDDDAPPERSPSNASAPARPPPDSKAAAVALASALGRWREAAAVVATRRESEKIQNALADELRAQAKMCDAEVNALAEDVECLTVALGEATEATEATGADRGSSIARLRWRWAARAGVLAVRAAKDRRDAKKQRNRAKRLEGELSASRERLDAATAARDDARAKLRAEIRAELRDEMRMEAARVAAAEAAEIAKRRIEASVASCTVNACIERVLRSASSSQMKQVAAARRDATARAAVNLAHMRDRGLETLRLGESGTLNNNGVDPIELVSLIAVHALERCEAHPHGDGARAFYRAARRIELAARACQPDYRGEGKTRGGLTPRGGEGVRGGAHVVETPLREGKEN